MRKLIFGAAVAAAVLVPVGLGGTLAGASTAAKGSKPPVKLSGQVNAAGTQTATGGKVDVKMNDFAFSPTFIKVPKGTTSVTVNLTNSTQHSHTFTLLSQNIDQVVAPGQTASVTVAAPAKGALAFFCRFHKQLGMQGAFFDKNGAKLVSVGGATTQTTAKSTSGGGSGGYGY